MIPPMKFNARAGLAVALLSLPLVVLGTAASCGTSTPPIIKPISKCPEGKPGAEGAADKWCADNTSCGPNEEGYCPYKNTVPNGGGVSCYTFCSACGCKSAGSTDPNFTDGEVEIIGSPSSW